jgi:hypothetical protein
MKKTLIFLQVLLPSILQTNVHVEYVDGQGWMYYLQAKLVGPYLELGQMQFSMPK